MYCVGVKLVVLRELAVYIEDVLQKVRVVSFDFNDNNANHNES